MSTVSQIFELHPKQLEAFRSPAKFTFYGGAAGGGKSHIERVIALCACAEVPGLQCYLGRRHYQELIHNHMEGPTSFLSMIADINSYLPKHQYIEPTEMKIKFPNGSNIHLFHCQYDKDVWKLVGPEIHLLLLEECTQFSEFQLRLLLSRVRMPLSMVENLPESIKYKYPRIFAAGNPGGESHELWKKWFIEPYERFKSNEDPLPVWQMRKDEGGRTAQFIPALVDDNPSIDPEVYKSELHGLRRPELIDAMLHGKWDIPMGAFFPELDERRHILRAFEIPSWLFKFRTFDWGSGAPFAVLWWAVADDSFPHIPEGALICYREWYGASPFDKRQGLGLSNEQVAYGIRERTPKSELIHGTVTDSKPFQAGGGITIAEEFKKNGVPLQLGDVKPGSRIQGWQQLRSRIIGSNGRPYIYFFDDCPEVWRTLTLLQTSKNAAHKGEDCDSSGEDHLPDAASLACKARPLVKKAPPKPPSSIEKEKLTMTDMITFTKEQRRRDDARIR